MKKLLTLGLLALLALPASALAAGEDVAIQELQKQIQKLSEELDDLSERLDSAEKHAATDRISFTGDARFKADSLVYKGVTVNQGMLVDFDQFGADAMAAMGGATSPFSGAELAAMMAAYPNLTAAFMAGQLSGNQMFGNGVNKYDADNSILYTTRLRLNMKAKVADNVNFAGRLTMYKNWGDSTGVKVFDSFNSFTMDGTDGGNTTGDFLRVERAYFDWNQIGGSPFYLSIGRRPSTYGPPSQYRENELRGGTPSGHLVHFNFDGITAGAALEDATGIPGLTARFCYGQGYESEMGNGTLFAETDVDDTHFAGFNVDMYNDGTTFLQLTAFRAFDIADSFKGLAMMPFADNDGDGIPDDMNGGAYISRFQGRENIGDMNLVGIGLTREEDNGLNWFASLGWTRTEPNANFNPMGLGGLLYDALPVMQVSGIRVDDNGNFAGVDMEHTGDYVRSKDWDKERNGYSVYVGVQMPAPKGKVGLEYNYGSKYWTPFTQGQDDIVGSKLAARGHVGEAYYIIDINPNMFLKIGGIYYDYEYTGSGSPVGLPKKVKDVQDGSEFSMFPVIDKAWDLNASMTVKF